MNAIYLDIETIPCQSEAYRDEVRQSISAPGQYKNPDSIAKWLEENREAAAQEAIAKTSFDPARGHICTIGFAIGEGDVKVVHAESVEGEGLVIETFFDALPALGMNRFIGHYITGFDLRFILCRAVVLGIKLPPKVSFPRDTKPWGDETFDTMTAWAGGRDKISMDALCHALGIDGKTGFDGSMVAEAWTNGEHAKIADYCRRDVEAVRAIHQRFEQVCF